jgi:hypothetical protein
VLQMHSNDERHEHQRKAARAERDQHRDATAPRPPHSAAAPKRPARRDAPPTPRVELIQAS